MENCLNVKESSKIEWTNNWVSIARRWKISIRSLSVVRVGTVRLGHPPKDLRLCLLCFKVLLSKAKNLKLYSTKSRRSKT
jgi:hypothetical protein